MVKNVDNEGQQKKTNQQEASKKMLTEGAKMAGTAFGGPVGGAVAKGATSAALDKALNKPRDPQSNGGMPEESDTTENGSNPAGEGLPEKEKLNESDGDNSAQGKTRKKNSRFTPSFGGFFGNDEKEDVDPKAMIEKAIKKKLGLGVIFSTIGFLLFTVIIFSILFVFFTLGPNVIIDTINGKLQQTKTGFEEFAQNLGNFFNNVWCDSGLGSGENCRERSETKFYEKAQKTYDDYKRKYDVELDMPLIVSTVFYNENSIDDVLGEIGKDNESESDYEFDYKSAQKQIGELAKAMVKKTIIHICVKDEEEEDDGKEEGTPAPDDKNEGSSDDKNSTGGDKDSSGGTTVISNPFFQNSLLKPSLMENEPAPGDTPDAPNPGDTPDTGDTPMPPDDATPEEGEDTEEEIKCPEGYHVETIIVYVIDYDQYKEYLSTTYLKDKFFKDKEQDDVQKTIDKMIAEIFTNKSAYEEIVYGYIAKLNNNYSGACQQIQFDGQVLPLEQYVAGVLYAEYGNMTDSPEMMKAATIVIRSYAVARSKNCTLDIGNSSGTQNYKIPPNDKYQKYANMTAGQVVTVGGEVLATEYFALYQPNCQGTHSEGGVTWCDITLEYYSNSGKFHDFSVPLNFLPNASMGAHYRGMPQYGAYYLAKEKGYTYHQILEEFYGTDAVINSMQTVYPSLKGVSMPLPFPSGTDLDSIITSYFGARIHPVTGKYQDAHGALDMRAGIGTPIYTVANGIVTAASYAGTYGNRVIVSHDINNDGQPDYYTLYAHLSKILVRVGDQVVGGQQIALSGNTGRTTGPHLHFEVRTKDNKAIDPYPFLVDIIKGQSIFKPNTISYLQYDSAWADTPYCGNSTMRNAGCFPTALAMIISNFGNEVNPGQLAGYICSNLPECFVEGKGTNAQCLLTDNTALSTKYHIRATANYSPTIDTVVNDLKNGKKIIISIHGSPMFNQTGNGHFVVLNSIDSNGRIEVLDPGKKANNRYYTQDEVKINLINYLYTRLWVFEGGKS